MYLLSLKYKLKTVHFSFSLSWYFGIYDADLPSTLFILDTIVADLSLLSILDTRRFFLDVLLAEGKIREPDVDVILFSVSWIFFNCLDIIYLMLQICEGKPPCGLSYRGKKLLFCMASLFLVI